MNRMTVRAGRDLEPGMPARSVHSDPVALPTIEARVFALVADLLGIDVDQLSREVSLVEDLAADSLDLAEIAVAIESALDVALPQRFLARVRTCGELVDGAVALTRTGRGPHAKGAEDEVPVRARVMPPGVPTPWTVERVLLLTPYAVETLTADALAAGVGARLELTVRADASEETLARLRRQFSRLGERGVHLDVRGERSAGHHRPSDAA
jgi:acyl carrier protein